MAVRGRAHLGRADARRSRPSLGGAARTARGVEVDLAADEAAVDAGPAHTETIASSRSRGASGIVTSTASGCRARVPPRARRCRRARARPAAAGPTGAGRRRRSRRPARPAVSFSSRSMLRPARPAPTSTVRCRSPRPRQSTSARNSARSANREAPIEHHAEEGVEHEHGARERRSSSASRRGSRPPPPPRSAPPPRSTRRRARRHTATRCGRGRRR